MDNKGIPKKDWDTLRSTLQEDLGDTTGTINDMRATQVIGRVLEQFNAGATYSLARMDRYPREVRVAVVYTQKLQPPTSLVWVVDKPIGGREWKISAQKTLSAMSVP